MKKTETAEPKPTSKSRLSAGAKAAVAFPLAISMIPALTTAIKSGSSATTPPAAVTAKPPKSGLVFKPGCQLPFQKIKTEGLNIDAVCTNVGNAKDEEDRLEFMAKNNFCADGNPIPITYADLIALQEAADSIAGLRQSLKTSRQQLLGSLLPAKPKVVEGALVQLVTFAKDARNSNPGAGEKVNCNLASKEENDIHIELMNEVDEEDPCKSVTAEMSPHFRPAEWQAIVKLSKKLTRPVRITGSLFFDNSHQPCRGEKRPNPKRISVWEIHPVYQFEICNVKTTELSKCDVAKNDLWVPLDQWDSAENDEEPN